MINFIKAQAAFILGSVVDFLATLFFVELLHVWYLAGNLAGNISGAILQFILCRYWVFDAAQAKISSQVPRFIMIYAGNFLLSAAGVYALTQGLGLHYLLSKIMISVLLGTTYNYLLQKKFVFKGENGLIS